MGTEESSKPRRKEPSLLENILLGGFLLGAMTLLGVGAKYLFDTEHQEKMAKVKFENERRTYELKVIHEAMEKYGDKMGPQEFRDYIRSLGIEPESK